MLFLRYALFQEGFNLLQARGQIRIFVFLRLRIVQAASELLDLFEDGFAGLDRFAVAASVSPFYTLASQREQ